jgi:parvulin-like peptidyl-prolyl isomerase
VVRSKHEAHQKIKNILKDLRRGVRTFEEIAKEESDCSDTHESGGNLGWIKRGTRPIGFENVAFALKLEDLSDPVETPHGWRLILRRGQNCESLRMLSN